MPSFSINRILPTVLLFCCLSAAVSAQSDGLKLYISCDMEGISGVVAGKQTEGSGEEYKRAQKLMTGELNAAIEGALAGGATEVLVNDSHGYMRNILIEELNPSTQLISGSPKPLSMMQGIDGSFDAAFFIGYHAQAGTAYQCRVHSHGSSPDQGFICSDCCVLETCSQPCSLGDMKIFFIKCRFHECVNVAYHGKNSQFVKIPYEVLAPITCPYDRHIRIQWCSPPTLFETFAKRPLLPNICVRLKF